MAKAPVVTIDGPSGSGKGTIARAVARAAGWHWLDSGALYRLVAVAGHQLALAPDDVKSHVQAARSLEVVFDDAHEGERVLLGGRDVTAEVRSERVGAEASRIAAWGQLREALLERQKAFARPPGLVTDGRDMGTVVFPDAELKIFLTASAAARALRRYNQLKDKGSGVSLAALSREIAERDARDSTRAVAPLKPASDAHVIDSTDLGIEEVVGRVLALGRSRSLWP
jgi:CMP/dCMP kinase